MTKKRVHDPGLGSKFQKPLTRLMNKDGSYNIVRKGGLKKHQDFYKYLIEVPLPWFLLILLLIYIGFNLLFALGYLLIGIDQLNGFTNDQSPFFNAFFFSTQTFTTVGYGSIAPSKLGAQILAMVEAFVGLLSFALATGLLYGRFSKPNTKIAFSENIIITPFEEGNALMFKVVNLRNNVLLKTKVKAFMSLDKGDGTETFNKDYFALNLETDNIMFFPLTWTLVHKINEDSPIQNLTLEDIKRRNGEVFVLIETFDETYAQEIVQKHSYGQEDWKEGVKFTSAFRPNNRGQLELHIDELNDLVEL
jgi:inward rectifier potassium channel